MEKDIYAHAVKRREGEILEDMNDMELFTSPDFAKYLDNLVATVAPGCGVTVEITANAPFVACTNGQRVMINVSHEIINSYETPDMKILAILGLLFHELAHVLFMDFPGEERMIEEVEAGYIPGIFNPADDNEEKLCKEMESFMKNEQARRLMVFVYHQLANVVADVNNEGKMIDAFGPFVEKSLNATTTALRASATSVEDALQNAQPLEMMFGLLLQQARFGELVTKTDEGELHKAADEIKKMSEPLELAIRSDKVVKKFEYINRIVMMLFEYIKGAFDDYKAQKQAQQQAQQSQQSQQSNSQQQQPGQPSASQGGANDPSDAAELGDQGQGNPQSQAQGAAGNQTEEGEGQNGQAGGMTQGNPQQTSSQGGQGGGDPFEGLSEEEIGQILSEIAKQLEEAAQEALGDAAQQMPSQNTCGAPKGIQLNPEGIAQAGSAESVMKQIARQKAEAAVEQKIANDTLAIVKTINQTSAHSGIKLKPVRQIQVVASDKNQYDRLMKDLRPYSKTLQRRMLEMFKDMQEGDTMKHKVVGRKLVASDTYRLDAKHWSTKKNPKEIPDMALSVLVDLSGSMSGQRISAARKAALLLDDFATGIKIPTMVAGHCCTDDYSCNIIIYSDFNRVNKNDSYRIAGMQEFNACNRDGMAISTVGELLAKRAEEIKLMIVISDGQPNHSMYGGEAAKKDIQDIVSRLEKKGVTVLALAIGGDKDTIKRIYKESYVDITDVTKLPKELVTMVRKRLSY